MEIKGTVIQVLPEQGGTSKAGNPWKKREFVIENTEGQFPRKICFTLFGQNVDSNPVEVGQIATVHFDLESREYNGRWYTEARAWRVAVEAGATTAPVNNGGGMQVPPPPIPTAAADEEFPF